MLFSEWVIARAREAADALAARMGISTPPLAWLAFAAQIANETSNGDPATIGVSNANPFNLTTGGGRYPLPGQIGAGSPGGSSTEWHTDFARFPDPRTGARAAGYFYSAEGDPAGYYAGVREAFLGGDPVAIASAIEASPFAGGHYSYNLAPVVARESGLAVNIDAAPYTPAAAADAGPMSAGAIPTLGDLTSAAGALGDIAGGAARVFTGAAAVPVGALRAHLATQLIVALIVILAIVLILGAL